MHVLEISAKLQNAEIYTVSLLKVFPSQTLTEQFQKFSEHSRKILAVESASARL